MVELDKLFGITATIILVDMLDLEFLWPDNLSE
jgi:hypothetical protein